MFIKDVLNCELVTEINKIMVFSHPQMKLLGAVTVKLSCSIGVVKLNSFVGSHEPLLWVIYIIASTRAFESMASENN